MVRQLWQATAAGVVLAAALVITHGQTSAQQPSQGQSDAVSAPPVTFKMEINYVTVDAQVVDAEGNFVPNLTKDDFQLLEDGKRQSITDFSLVRIPVTKSEPPLPFLPDAVEPDVVTNERAFEGRLYVIVLDDLHTDPLRTVVTQTAARKFIQENMGANDMAAIVATSGRTELAQDLTGSRRQLLAAVDKFLGQKLPSATAWKTELYNFGVGTGNMRPDERVDDPFNLERLYNARRALTTVRGISEWLSGVRGRRKAMVYISEGIDYDVTDVFANRDGTINRFRNMAGEVSNEIRDAVAAATRSSVVVYTVDPRGLSTMSDESITMASVADVIPGNTSGGPAIAPSGNNVGRFDLGQISLQNELEMSQNSLRALADDTGGFATVNRNNLTEPFDRIQSENSSYYVIGYYPEKDNRDGKFRSIDLRVTRPNLSVRTRKGYFAPRSGKSAPAPARTSAPDAANAPTPALQTLLQSPLPVSGLTLNVSAMTFRGTAPNASVAVLVEAPGRLLKFNERNGTFNNTITMAISAFDKDGKMVTGKGPRVGLELRPDAHQTVVQNGVRVLSRLDLPPGRYKLRVAAQEDVAMTEGSVHYDLEVPDYAKKPLDMSSIALAAASDHALPFGSDLLFGGSLPVPPTALREFPAGDELMAVAEIYDNVATPSHTVEIVTTVRTYEGRELASTTETRTSEEVRGMSGAYRYSAHLPLKGVPAGSYLLTMQARSTLGNEPPVSRMVQFVVR